MASLSNPKYIDKVHAAIFMDKDFSFRTLCAIKKLNVLMTKDVEKITCGNCKRKLHEMKKKEK